MQAGSGQRLDTRAGHGGARLRRRPLQRLEREARCGRRIQRRHKRKRAVRGRPFNHFENLQNHFGDTPCKAFGLVKKGLVQSPFFVIDAPSHGSGRGPIQATPGSQSCTSLRRHGASGVPVWSYRLGEWEAVESTIVSIEGTVYCGWKCGKVYKISHSLVGIPTVFGSAAAVGGRLGGKCGLRITIFLRASYGARLGRKCARKERSFVPWETRRLLNRLSADGVPKCCRDGLAEAADVGSCSASTMTRASGSVPE